MAFADLKPDQGATTTGNHADYAVIVFKVNTLSRARRIVRLWCQSLIQARPSPAINGPV